MRIGWKGLSIAMVVGVICAPLWMRVVSAQTRADTQPVRSVGAAPLAELAGRNVESVRVLGNLQVPTAVILNVVRTREGEPFDPQTVEEDYQRIFDLKRFANVEAKVEPTASGVIVAFVVSEQRQIKAVNFKGNRNVSTDDLQDVTGIQTGQSIDQFQIALARQSIERYYREENYPYAHVNVDSEALARTGELTFNIVEGPRVRIRSIEFRGNRSFTAERLQSKIQTSSWLWIFRSGRFDPDQLEDDVAAIRRYYEGKGFFDVKVGRLLSFGPDQREMQITFVIDEGVRYTVERLSFKGNANVTEAQLRQDLKLVEGEPFDRDVLDRDVRQIVRAYSPYGFIYQPPPAGPNPDYLRIEPKPVFRRNAGKVELVYDIQEGKSFRLGRIIIKGNTKTQDKVILREMRVAPGQLYNSAEIADATDRLRGTPFFTSVNMTPIGTEPDVRDLLVEVNEGRTAMFTIGAGVNSNGGVAGNITYEQRNYDIANWPSNWNEVFSERAWVGAGQTLRASFEPGTRQTNASIRFVEPWLFDQPYSFTNDLYLRNRIREHYDENRVGDRVSFGKRFSYVWSGLISFRGEDVEISSIEDPEIRAPEILEYRGHTTVTSAGPSIRRDTTNHGPIPYRGTNTSVGWESVGALGGDAQFQRFTGNWDAYITLDEDLLDRRTVLGLHLDSGWIPENEDDVPFFERFYGGGLGSIRGFQYRGISPRTGPDDDPVGGLFSTTGSVELGFPLAGDNLRGVIFSDVGTVEREPRLDRIRSSVGFGIRFILPVFGQAPLSLDFGFPLTKFDQDEMQVISFSFGFIQ